MRASISIAIAGLVWFSTYVSAQPNKELYELQERCGKRAEEFFRREYGTVPKTEYGITMWFNYENHYSARLNKCFFLEIAVSWEKEILSDSSRISFVNLSACSSRARV